MWSCSIIRQNFSIKISGPKQIFLSPNYSLAVGGKYIYVFFFHLREIYLINVDVQIIITSLDYIEKWNFCICHKTIDMLCWMFRISIWLTSQAATLHNDVSILKKLNIKFSLTSFFFHFLIINHCAPRNGNRAKHIRHKI